MGGESMTRMMNERKRLAQHATDAAGTQHTRLAGRLATAPTCHEGRCRPSLHRPCTSRRRCRHCWATTAGLRVMSVYSGQDELADTIRAKSAQVVHLVPAAHRMSLSTAASSEVDGERMLQSAPVSAGHSREDQSDSCRGQTNLHRYPASAPLSPHESVGPDLPNCCAAAEAGEGHRHWVRRS